MAGLFRFSYKTRVVMNSFPRIKAGMESKAGRIVAKVAHDLEAGMKVKAPVRDGFLRDSIQAQQVGRMHWRVTVGMFYGIYVEYGTRHSRAQPYFFPTIAEIRPQFKEAMRSVTR